PSRWLPGAGAVLLHPWSRAGPLPDSEEGRLLPRGVAQRRGPDFQRKKSRRMAHDGRDDADATAPREAPSSQPRGRVARPAPGAARLTRHSLPLPLLFLRPRLRRPPRRHFARHIGLRQQDTKLAAVSNPALHVDPSTVLLHEQTGY